MLNSVLVYEDTGKQVKLGDKPYMKSGQRVEVTGFAHPYVVVKLYGFAGTRLSPSAIGAKWREEY